MKTILISNKPKWCELIALGKKTKDERKTAPKEVPFRVLMYCAKEKKQDDIIWAGAFGDRGKWNGKVIGEFICNKVDKLWGADAETEKQTCLSLGELFAYANDKPIYGLHITDLKLYDKPRELGEFYGYNKELEQRFLDGEDYCCYDATNEYGEAMTECDGENIHNCYRCWEEWSGWCHRITRPPQSYMFVESPDWEVE